MLQQIWDKLRLVKNIIHSNSKAIFLSYLPWTIKHVYVNIVFRKYLLNILMQYIEIN